jgi:hypothetical protein
MPLSQPTSRKHLHTRTVTCHGYQRDDGLWDIEGHLVDIKHYDFDNEHRGVVRAGEPVHEMWLRLSIDDDLQIQKAEAVTDYGPYAMCPDITPNFARLEGLRIGPGFHREVHKRVGGVNGCTHLVELLRPLATAAFQTLVAKRRAREADPDAPPRRPVLIDTCHAHASDSPVTKRRWPDFYTGPDSAA